MEDKACSLLGLNLDLKKSRDQLKPLKEQLIKDMQAVGRSSISAGNNMEIKLIERKARKAVGSKAMFGIIQDKLGAEAVATVRAACEEAKGEPVSKISLKICEAE